MGRVKRGRKLQTSVALLSLVVAFLCESGLAQAESTSSVPKLTTPEAYCVMPFDNRSGSAGLEWMRVAVPFVLAERAEGFTKLRPVYDEHVVPRARKDKSPMELKSIAAYAKSKGAKWAFHGWIKRPDWKLEMGFSLYQVHNGSAVLVAETTERGEFKDVHALVGRALTKLSKEAGLSSKDDDHELLQYESTTDFYAFTLFGRGLGLMHYALTPVDWAAVEKLLRRTVYIDPNLTEAQQMLAKVYRRNGKATLAKVRLEFALKRRPRYAPAIEALAQTARSKGQIRRAVGLFEDVLRLRPWDLETRYALGNSYWEIGRQDEAFAQLSLVAEADPKHIKARRALVLVHASRSDNANLVKELQQVAALAPKDVETKLELAAALVASDRLKGAISTYKEIVALDDKSVQAHKFLGDLYRKQGQGARAIRSYGLAIKANAKDPRAYFLLGAMYVESGDDESARRIYLKAQRFVKYRPEAFNNLGAIELRRKRYGQSIWYLRRAVKQKPKRAGYRYNLALSLAETKAHDEALVEVNQALALNPKHVESSYLKGVVELGLGRAENARRSFERTLALDGDHADAAHNLSLLDALKRRSTEGELVVEGK
jgi:tetratricopeptide (TPR) repeat protein